MMVRWAIAVDYYVRQEPVVNEGMQLVKRFDPETKKLCSVKCRTRKIIVTAGQQQKRVQQRPRRQRLTWRLL